jgi:DNA-binding LacI/PurR family transcriptional regulator
LFISSKVHLEQLSTVIYTGSMSATSTIRDVASAAGVSVGTVSRVMNGHPAVSPQTEAVVRQAMTRLQYQPPPLLNRRGPKPGQRRAVAQGRQVRRIALMIVGVPQVQLQSPIYSELLNGVHAGVQAADHELVVAMLEPADEARLQTVVRQVDGVVCFCAAAGAGVLRSLPGRCSVQVFGQVQVGEWWDHVTYDNAAIGPLAAAWLRGRGHQHGAILGSSGPGAHFQQRQQGFCTAWPTARAFVGDDLLLAPAQLNTVDRPRLAALVDALLASDPRPTGVFVPADMQTVVVQALLLERGMVPGRDLELLSCNREELLLAGLHPRPATIDIHAHRIGQRAAEQVLWRLDHPGEPAVHQTLEPEVVPGTATA